MGLDGELDLLLNDFTLGKGGRSALVVGPPLCGKNHAIRRAAADAGVYVAELTAARVYETKFYNGERAVGVPGHAYAGREALNPGGYGVLVVRHLDCLLLDTDLHVSFARLLEHVPARWLVAATARDSSALPRYITSLFGCTVTHALPTASERQDIVGNVVSSTLAGSRPRSLEPGDGGTLRFPPPDAVLKAGAADGNPREQVGAAKEGSAAAPNQHRLRSGYSGEALPQGRAAAAEDGGLQECAEAVASAATIPQGSAAAPEQRFHRSGDSGDWKNRADAVASEDTTLQGSLHQKSSGDSGVLKDRADAVESEDTTLQESLHQKSSGDSGVLKDRADAVESEDTTLQESLHQKSSGDSGVLKDRADAAASEDTTPQNSSGAPNPRLLRRGDPEDPVDEKAARKLVHWLSGRLGGVSGCEVAAAARMAVKLGAAPGSAGGWGGVDLGTGWFAASRGLSSFLTRSDDAVVHRVSFADITGHDHAKAAVRRALSVHRLPAPVKERLGLRPFSGVLLYGLPGNGKTLLAKAVATELASSFLHASVPSVVKGYVGESEKKVRELFERARRNAPCCVFLDEVQAVFGDRDDDTGDGGGHESRVVSQLLSEMDGLPPSVTVIAATNVPQSLDLSLISPGRLDLHIHVAPPTAKDRADYLIAHHYCVPASALSPDAQAELARAVLATENYSYADLATLANLAQLFASEDKTLMDAVAATHASATPEMLHRILSWRPVVSQLLSEMDGLPPSVTVTAATNVPESLDLSLISPGRLDLHIQLAPPTAKDRADYLVTHYCVPASALSPDAQAELARAVLATENYSYADLATLANRAQLFASEDKTLVDAVAATHASATPEMLHRILSWCP
ncbi:Protein SAV [Diplonema papillatum]|nr:Protein SAV [Diplonema papillatum]